MRIVTTVTRCRHLSRAAFLFGLVAFAGDAVAMLDETGFRAVAVALARHPIAALAVAPDGRLFAAVQALEQTTADTAGTAEIRVFSSYHQTDGSVLDEGAVWATVEGIRATTNEEGLLGLALAPDFATSKLVYVHLTTTDNDGDQQVRVYRERPDGTGEYLGTVATDLEPPAGVAARSAGYLGFGADGCLYVGVGDNAGRWNAQVLAGTDPVGNSEAAALCTAVCAGSQELPDRTVAHNGQPNLAGKILRLAVEGPSTAQEGPASPVASAPRVFAVGFRNPAGLATHPLSGQLWVAERGDALEAEIGIVEPGSNHGWPCLEGTRVSSSAAACIAGTDPQDVYARHPAWRRPVVVHPGSNVVVTGLAAYSGLAYPAAYYGDLFYLLRDSARIYRVDLEPPCFLAPTTTIATLPFHDSNRDGDFRALYDVDDDGDFDNVAAANLTAIVQAPDPLGREVLYVAGRQNNSSDMQADSVVYRIEYATAFVPWEGPTGRVADSCFAGLDNPFARPRCLAPGGPCPGQPDGMSCDDGNTCNGSEACRAGICRAASTPAADGTVCDAADACRAPGTCRAGLCEPGLALPDGTVCGDADPCNGQETCEGGACVPGRGPESLALAALAIRPSGGLSLRASAGDAAFPEARDHVALSLATGGEAVLAQDLGMPEDGPPWRRSPATARWRRPGRGADGVSSFEVRRASDGVTVRSRGRAAALRGSATTELTLRLVVGQRCFSGRAACRPRGAGLRCGG